MFSTKIRYGRSAVDRRRHVAQLGRRTRRRRRPRRGRSPEACLRPPPSAAVPGRVSSAARPESHHFPRARPAWCRVELDPCFSDGTEPFRGTGSGWPRHVGLDIISRTSGAAGRSNIARTFSGLRKIANHPTNGRWKGLDQRWSRQQVVGEQATRVLVDVDDRQVIVAVAVQLAQAAWRWQSLEPQVERPR